MIEPKNIAKQFIDKDELLRAIDFQAYYSAELGSEIIPRDRDGWVNGIRCPFPDHDDKTPSFGVNIRTGAFKCFGCNRKGDLFEFHMQLHGSDFRAALKELAKFAGIDEEPQKRQEKPFHHPQLGAPIETYPYLDENSKPVLYVCRFKPKDFRQCRPDGRNWSIKGIRQVPYHLPQLLSSNSLVLILEGEKDVHTAEKHEFIATTNAGGANSWTDENSRILAGRDVVIISDCDEPGEQRTKTIIQSFKRIEIHPTSVKVIRLPNPNNIKGYDLADFFNTFSDMESAKTELSALIEKTPPIDFGALPVPDADNKSNNLEFRLVKAGDLKTCANQWLIEGLIAQDTLSVIFGDPATYKSFVSIALACCAASGKFFYGSEVKLSGPVIYIAGEGQAGISRRIRAWCLRNSIDIDALPLFLSTMAAGLSDSDQLANVLRTIDIVKKEYGSPVLIIVDTLARNFGNGDENSTRDMNKFVESLDQLRITFNSAILVVHHTGHSNKKRSRGNIALQAAVDAEYRLSIYQTDLIRMECIKMKDAEEPSLMNLRPEIIELDEIDEDGNQLTSVVLCECNSEIPASSFDGAGRGKWQKSNFRALDRLINEQKENSEMPCVTEDDWRNACIKEGCGRSTFKRSKDSFINRGKISVENGLVRIL